MKGHGLTDVRNEGFTNSPAKEFTELTACLLVRLLHPDVSHSSRLRVEQNGRSAHHLVPWLKLSSLILLFFSLCFFSRHYLLPSAGQNAYFKERHTRRVRPTRSNHGPSRPHCPAPFSFISSFLYPTDVVSPSRTASTSAKLLPRCMGVHIHLSYFFLLFMCLYSLYSISITGTPEVTLQYRS